MLIVKETGAEYTFTWDKNIANWLIPSKLLIAKVDRPLTMVDNPNYVEPQTPSPEDIENEMNNMMFNYGGGFNYNDEVHNPKQIYKDDITEEEVFNGIKTLYEQPGVAENPDFLLYLNAIKDKYLSLAKFVKKLEINKFKDKIENSNVNYMGHEFQADELSKNKLTWTITIIEKSIQANAGSNFNVDEVQLPEGFDGWVDANNNKVPMTYKQLIGLGAAMSQNVMTATYVANTLKNQLETLQTVEEVNALKVEVPSVR